MATKKKNTKNHRTNHPIRSFVAPRDIGRDPVAAAAFEQLAALHEVEDGIRTVEQLQFYLPRHAADLEHYFTLGRSPREQLSGRSKSRYELTARCLNGYGNTLRRLFRGDFPRTRKPFGIFSAEELEQVEFWERLYGGWSVFQHQLNRELFEYVRNRVNPALSREPHVIITAAKLQRFFRGYGVANPTALVDEMLACGDAAPSTWGDIRLGAERVRGLLMKYVRKIPLSELQPPPLTRDVHKNQVEIVARFRELVRAAARGGQTLPELEREAEYLPSQKELAGVASSAQRLADAALNDPKSREARWLAWLDVPADSALANGVRIRANGVRERGEGEGPPRSADHPTTTVTELAEWSGVSNRTIRQELVKRGCPNAEKTRGEIPTAWLQSDAGRGFRDAIAALLKSRSN